MPFEDHGSNLWGEVRLHRRSQILVLFFYVFTFVWVFVFMPSLVLGEWWVNGDRGFGVGWISLSTLISHFGQSAALKLFFHCTTMLASIR